MTDVDATANEVAENAPVRAPVGITAWASDPENGTLLFSLRDSPDGPFAIDRLTGVVVVADVLDSEAMPSHELTVRAEDASGAWVEAVFVVVVSGVEDAMLQHRHDLD